jgi:ketosteroid isomerase-like protein
VPFPFFPAIVALATASGGAPDDALQSLVEAERGFSRMSVEQGMRDAFMTHLADDAIVFQPLPVNGKQVWGPRPKSAATLIWEPAFAEISAAGDLGYTTGPWEFRPPADKPGASVLHGHFHSVWKRAKDGPWRVAVDIGGAHDALEPGVGSGAFAAGPVHAASPKGDRSRAAAKEILDAEQRFSKEAERAGFAGAFAAVAAADVRLGREGSGPTLGIEAARGALATDAAHARWTPAGSGASRSGDLGYAYGVRERLKAAGAAPDTSVFLDVWRREGNRWRLALAVDNPVQR